MTKQIRNLFGLALLVAAVSASAQIKQTVHVNVPFSFVASGKTLPAAEYSIEITRASGLVIMTSPKSAPVAEITIKDSRPAAFGKSYLRFQHYGDSWVLREVTVDGTAQVMNTGKSERELAKVKPSGEQTLMASSGAAH